MTSSNDDIHNTQQLANAAEAFVSALGAWFPGDTFEQFFHGSTLRRAYWSALQAALEGYSTPDNAAFARGLMTGQALADERVIRELLKLFLPGQTPDYLAVAGYWGETLSIPAREHEPLARSAELLFMLLAAELRRSPDLRIALYRLAQIHGQGFDIPADIAATAEHDLNRLLDAALVSGPNTLALQVRHLMALAVAREPAEPGMNELRLNALVTLAEYLAPSDLRRVWTSLYELPDASLRLRLLGRLAPYLSARQLVPDALALVQNTIQTSTPPVDPAVRVEVLLDLAPHLDTPNQDQALPPFQYRVFAGVQSISDPASRVRALGALIGNLSVELQLRAISLAFDAAGSVPSDMARATALSVLPPHLPPEFHTRLLGLAYEIEMPEARALLMGRMIPYLPSPLQAQALTGALHAIEQITGEDARTAALITLAPYIDSVGPLRYMPQGLRQAIMVTFTIERRDDRARAFAALVPYLSPELLTEALQVIKGIRDDHDRAATLTRLAPHLPVELQSVAFGIAHEIHPAAPRASALAAIAPYLAPTARAQALSDALAAALAIESPYDQVLVLADLSPHLPEDLLWRAMQNALVAARAIPSENERARALVFVAPHLPKGLLLDAVRDAYEVSDPVERVSALSALMPRLSDEPRQQVAQDVIDLAAASRPPHHKASILASVALVLPPGLVERAVEEALGIDTPYDRMHVLSALLPRMPDLLRDEVLDAAQAVPDRYQRVNALLELIPYTTYGLRQPILDQALETALGISDDYDRASALAHLAPYLDTHGDSQGRQQHALSLALDACLELTDPGQRAVLLGRAAAVWAQILTPAQSYALWRRVVAFTRRRPHTEVLTDLAALSPVIDLMGAPTAVEEIAGTLVVVSR
ncbi:MAG: hypothetical protein HY866_09905 [Chloroflexi bacterium]|nr:hypothetical protein [Chloroflexota bacterium]